MPTPGVPSWGGLQVEVLGDCLTEPAGPQGGFWGDVTLRPLGFSGAELTWPEFPLLSPPHLCTLAASPCFHASSLGGMRPSSLTLGLRPCAYASPSPHPFCSAVLCVSPCVSLSFFLFRTLSLSVSLTLSLSVSKCLHLSPSLYLLVFHSPLFLLFTFFLDPSLPLSSFSLYPPPSHC